jgi:LuxR family maltose regulon positive regulatory protein
MELSPTKSPESMPRTFSVPRVLRNVVTRQRVVDRLEAASRNPLTVVRAPAGAGKTVAVSDWAERRSSASDLIWITLDSSISGRYAFWARLIDAVNDSGIAPPDSIFANTVPSAAAASGLMPSLLGGLARLERPLTIVIDDYHHIREREVHDDVIWLLQQSSTLSVVVVTRKVSPLESAENLVKQEGSLVLGPELAFSAVCTSRLSQGVYRIGSPAAAPLGQHDRSVSK